MQCKLLQDQHELQIILFTENSDICIHHLSDKHFVVES